MLALSRWEDILFRRVDVVSSMPCLDRYVNCMRSMNSVVWLESSLCYMCHRFAEQRCESNGPVIRECFALRGFLDHCFPCLGDKAQI